MKCNHKIYLNNSFCYCEKPELHHGSHYALVEIERKTGEFEKTVEKIPVCWDKIDTDDKWT